MIISPMYLVFDIGGTNMRITISSDGKTLSSTKIVPTPTDFDQGIQALKQVADELSQGQKIEAVTGGLPGSLDSKKTMTTNSANLPDWNNKPLKEILQKELNAPAFLENDAALAGLGEAIDGAGQGHKIVAYMTISTGVGGARIVDGKIDSNSLGFEPGYQIIHNEKVLGDYVSGRALETLTGQKPEDIKDPKVWDSVARYLAVGLNNIVVFWSPDIIVLGGSVTKSIPLDKVRGYLKELLKIFPDQPEIVQAKLGDSAGLYGALAYLNQQTP